MNAHVHISMHIQYLVTWHSFAFSLWNPLGLRCWTEQSIMCWIFNAAICLQGWFVLELPIECRNRTFLAQREPERKSCRRESRANWGHSVGGKRSQRGERQRRGMPPTHRFCVKDAFASSHMLWTFQTISPDTCCSCYLLVCVDSG